MTVASVKVEADRESTETATMIITCSRMGCRRPVRPEILDHSFLPICDEHQGLLQGGQRWGIYCAEDGWLADLGRRVFTWDSEACRQWATPETLMQDLDASGKVPPLAFAILKDGSSRVTSGFLVLRMR